VINIKIKGPMKSWTNRKTQIAIWTDALLERLKLLYWNNQHGKLNEQPSLKAPPLPILIVQGHEWHLLIVTKDLDKMIIREQIGFGNTRTCFNAMKVVAALHWLMDWAERVWRPWFMSLLPQVGG
jgi:hypothetical protein